MREALEDSRVLKNGGYLVLVAANNQVCGQQVENAENTYARIAEEIGFTTHPAIG